MHAEFMVLMIVLGLLFEDVCGLYTVCPLYYVNGAMLEVLYSWKYDRPRMI